MNRIEDRNHTIISIDKFQQNSTSFHDKSSQETRNGKNVPQYNKNYI
jgi:hypothetical protein